MRGNLDLWIEPFPQGRFPALPCPRCTGSLGLVPKSLNVVETAESRAGHRHEDWDPGWVEEHFSGLLRCTCGESVHVVGTTEQEFDPQTGGFDTRLRLCFAFPGPPLFQIPKGCPEKVKVELEAAFQLFLPDPSAAANRLRAAVERLLDHFGVRKGTKHKRIALHNRIEQHFTRSHPRSAELLLAVKWLGNEGSHRALFHREVYLGFELIEDVLERLFVKRRTRLARRARAINRSRGPVRPRRPRGRSP